jgi:predicted thioesterase
MKQIKQKMQIKKTNNFLRRLYMEFNLKVGEITISEKVVEEKDTAAAFGSGDILVFATPMMSGLMENASLKNALSQLPEGFTTVGTFVEVKHMAATPVGMKVKAEAELVEADGKKLKYKVTAYDEKGKIGEGYHGRYIINSEEFLKKINNK